MRRFRAVIGIITVASGGVFADAIYNVQALQIPAGYEDVALGGINNSGQVAGYGLNIQAGSTQSFISTVTSAVPIPALSSYGTTNGGGIGINSSGQVVGSVQGPTQQAFIATSAGVTLIPLDGASGSQGLAINDLGQVTGYETLGGVNEPFIGTVSGMTPIPLPAGWSFGFGYAINNSGEVAGQLAGLDNTSFRQAYVGTPSGVTLIPVLSGWTDMSATSINNGDEASGVGNNAADNLQAFVFTTSGVMAIPLPVGATTAQVYSQGMNDSGVVVGYSDAGAWMWDPTNGVVLLNSLVPSGWNVTQAISISDSGLILAYGSYNGGASEYVELSAAPEPSTCFLTFGGLLLAFIGRRVPTK